MGKYRILIVDDEVMSVCVAAYWIINLLSEEEKRDSVEFNVTDVKLAVEHSFEVWDKDLIIDVARNVNGATSKIVNNIYNLIILDGDLSCDEHGRDILQKMNNSQKMVVIIISGDDNFLKEAECQNIYAMSKPTNRDILRDYLVVMGLIKQNVLIESVAS